MAGDGKKGENAINIQVYTQLLAVVIGGLLAISGSILTTLLVERRQRRREARNLALAFKGEISALIGLIEERRYIARITEIMAQIERTQQPFYMPLRMRFRYAQVYEQNVARIGLLAEPLPELIPNFYTHLLSVMEDMNNLSEGVYSGLELGILLRLYGDTARILEQLLQRGKEIIAQIERMVAEE